MTLLKDLQMAYQLAKPIQGSSHQERLENFYREQAQDYDRFRKRLLPRREELYRSVSGLTKGVWLDFGGGTGANLESIASEIDQFDKISIIDLCPSLLSIATQRIQENNWQQVEAIWGDATQYTPAEGLVDLITFSYSLTMIPDWFAAIENAYKLLKPGGYIGVVDFYVPRKHPPSGWQSHSGLSRYFWTIWFAIDNVFLSPDHAAYLHHWFDCVSFVESTASVPLIPGLKVPYYSFIGRKRIIHEMRS